MREKIIIVDEKDTIIGSKYRDEVEHGTDIYRVSALRIENNKNEVLLAQRAFSKKSNPGKRGPAVAGTNAEGETYESNIVKETKEEVGISLGELFFGPYYLVHGYQGRRYYLQRFYCKIDKDLHEFTIQEEEVEKIMWISKVELLNMVKKSPEKFTSNALKYIPMMIEFTENLTK